MNGNIRTLKHCLLLTIDIIPFLAQGKILWLKGFI